MLYFGPELLTPVASVLAGLVGMLLMFWQRVVSGVRRVAGRSRLLLQGLVGAGPKTEGRSSRTRSRPRGRSGSRR